VSKLFFGATAALSLSQMPALALTLRACLSVRVALPRVVFVVLAVSVCGGVA